VIADAPGISTGTLDRIKLYAARNERRLAVTFFIAGFLFDILTLGRIDAGLTIGQQAVYLALVTVVLVQTLLSEERPGPDLAAAARLKRWYFEYRNPAIHFLLGALLSAYTLFFFKSSSLLVSFGFMGVLVALLIANESARFKALGLPFKFALLALCWLSFFATLLPVLAGSIGLAMFLASMLAGSLPLAGAGVALSFLTILALAQLSGLAIHALSRNRRLHDIALSLGIVFGFALSLVPLLLLTRGLPAFGGVLGFLVRTDLFVVSPFAWGVRAAVYAGRGEAAGFLGFSVLGALAIAAAMAASAHLIHRIYRGDVSLEAGSRSAGSSRMIFGGPIGALLEKDVRSAWRDPALRTLLLIGFTGPLFFLFVITQTPLDWRSGRPLLFLATIVGISSFGANALGFERRGIGLLLSFPVPRERLLVAKNLSATLFRLPSFFTLIVATLGLASPALLPAVLTVTVVTMLQAAAVDNYHSILFPVAAPAPGKNPYGGTAGGGRGLAASVMAMLVPSVWKNGRGRSRRRPRRMLR